MTLCVMLVAGLSGCGLDAMIGSFQASGEDPEVFIGWRSDIGLVVSASGVEATSEGALDGEPDEAEE